MGFLDELQIRPSGRNVWKGGLAVKRHTPGFGVAIDPCCNVSSSCVPRIFVAILNALVGLDVVQRLCNRFATMCTMLKTWLRSFLVYC